MAYYGGFGKEKNLNSSELTTSFGSKLINNVAKKNKTNSDLLLCVNIKVSEIRGKIDICYGINKCDDVTANVIYSEISNEGHYIIPVCLPTNCYVKVAVVGNCTVDYINVVAMGM